MPLSLAKIGGVTEKELFAGASFCLREAKKEGANPISISCCTMSMDTLRENSCRESSRFLNNGGFTVNG